MELELLLEQDEVHQHQTEDQVETELELFPEQDGVH